MMTVTLLSFFHSVSFSRSNPHNRAKPSRPPLSMFRQLVPAHTALHVLGEQTKQAPALSRQTFENWISRALRLTVQLTKLVPSLPGRRATRSLNPSRERVPRLGGGIPTDHLRAPLFRSEQSERKSGRFGRGTGRAGSVHFRTYTQNERHDHPPVQSCASDQPGRHRDCRPAWEVSSPAISATNKKDEGVEDAYCELMRAYEALMMQRTSEKKAYDREISALKQEMATMRRPPRRTKHEVILSLPSNTHVHAYSRNVMTIAR
eukprot:1371694-Rhodomonas_salina.1